MRNKNNQFLPFVYTNSMTDSNILVHCNKINEYLQHFQGTDLPVYEQDKRELKV